MGVKLRLSFICRLFIKKPLDKTASIVYTVYIRYIRSDLMKLLINNRDGAPIYDQIYSQIKDQILSGELAEESPLPSIRNLAKDLRVSVITTKRAYDELEKEGFLYTVAGKGCFVAPKNLELIREQNLKKLEEHMQEIVRLAAVCGLSRADIIELFSLLSEENETGGTI